MRIPTAAFLLGTAVIAHGAPVHLRTNSLDAPLSLATTQPTFSWRSDATTPNWMQSAYEILVATDAGLLTSGKPDIWDGGRTASSESVNIAYSGPPLKAQQRYVWAVRTWDNKNHAVLSAPATFETGLMTPADWKAGWIMRRNEAAIKEHDDMRWVWLPHADAKHVASSTPAHFRYQLHLADAPLAASLHVLTRGDFIAHVNGHQTGQHKEWGAFDREEILQDLHTGDNEIEIDVVSPKTADNATVPAAFAASIHVTSADGAEQRITTGDSWQVRSTPEAQWQPAASAGPLSEPFSIGTDRKGGVAGPDRVATDASLLRKDFTLANRVKRARLTITALGAYQAYLNGKPVAPGTLLSPGWTDFHKRVLYQTYDVTSLLAQGPNTIGVMLGGGWYSSPMTWAGYRDTPGPNLLRAQLDLDLADGSHQAVITDPTWLTAPSPITFSEIYGGESFDARLAQTGWSTPGFHSSHWTPAVSADAPSAAIELTAEPDLPIHGSIVLHPAKLTPANDAHGTVYDMGQNMVGNIRLHVSGAKGSVIRLRYAERLNPDGSLYTENLRNADATDTYALAGNGPETWTPAFTFHGFRYVELSVLTKTEVAAPSLATIEGLVQNSLPDVPSVRLTSSSEILNKMNELGAWGQRGNFVSIPTDCPQRDERLGWMGDAGAFWRTGTFNFDIAAFTHKFMLDVTDAQTSAGAFSDVSPNLLGDGPGAPGWGDAGVFIPYAAWLQYGDTAVVQRSWPAMERWMEFIGKSNPDYLRRKELGNNYADWLAPDENTPKDLIATAYWALIAREMTEMATALHRPEDAAKYKELYDHIAAAYRTAYVHADGSVAGNTQTAYLATVFTGIAPEAQRPDLVNRLVKDIEAHGNHLTTGFLGTPFLLSVLDANGHSDLAFKLLLSDTYPSWGYMVSKGATTWWERWNGDTGDPSMNSYNHYAFGSVMAWVYRRAAGIDTDPSGAGYHHLTVAPLFDPALPQLHTEYDSAYGTVVSDWQQNKHRFTVTIPSNTTATITLPQHKPEDIGSGAHTYTIQ